MKVKNKRILKIILFSSIFFILQYCIGWCLVSDYTDYGRAVIHNLYTEPKIEGLFLGNSHIYRAIDPAIMDEKLGIETFVCASPGLELDGSYALLREAYRKHPEIKNVYVDLDFVLLNKPPIKDKTNFKPIWRVSNYLKEKDIKYNYLFHTIPVKNYPDIFLKIGKHKFTINPKKIRKTLIARLNGNYQKHIYPSSSDLNKINKGFIGKDVDYGEDEEEGLLNELTLSFSIDKIDQDWYGFVQNIIDFCKENNLELVFFSVPESFSDVLNLGNYDECAAFLRNFFDEKDCKYYDFNLCRKEYLSLKTSDYYDAEHLNKNGSAKICEAVANVLLSKTEEEAKSYFYNSFEERALAEEENVFGFTIIESEDKKSCEFIPITNKKNDSILTFDFYSIDSDGNKMQLADKTLDNVIVYPQKIQGKIEGKCYLNGNFVCKVCQKFDTRWFK